MLKRSIAAGALVLGLATPAFAQFSNTIFFGDSLTDSGTFFVLGAVPPGTGKFTTNPGPVWSEVLAASFGKSAIPAEAGGTNFAIGGARVSDDTGFPASGLTQHVTSVSEQITSYLASNGGRADGGALYSVWAGANDIFTIAVANNPAAAQGTLIQAAGDFVTQVVRLKAAGARFVIVPTVPDIGATPFGASTGLAGAAGLTALSQGYNQLVFGGLGAAGIQVIPADIFTLLHEILATPATYGFTDPLATTVPACTTASSLICTASTLRPGATPLNTVFADSVHPTTGAHQIIADYVSSLIAAPRQISLLAESAVKTRMALTSNLFDQLAAAGWSAPEGARVWATLGAGQLKFEQNDDFAGAKGTPLGLSVGVDKRLSSALTVGAAGTAARFEPDFEGSGGFTQDDLALSLYGAYASGGLRIGAVGTLGQSHFDVTRDVRLGPTTRTINGSTSAANVSLAAQAGYELGSGALSHGPTLGLELQRVDVKGFSESNGGSAGLTFDSQRRTSLVGSVGYRASYDMGRFLPFGRVSLDHEFRDTDRTVTAFLQTLSAPGFELPAAKLERTWGTLALGSAMKIAPNLTASLVLSSQLGQSNVRNYGMQLGLSMGL